MFQRYQTLLLLCSALILSNATQAADQQYPVKITSTLPYVDLTVDGKPLRLQRNQDTENMVDLDFAVTSRECPPFCIQPMNIAPGVETIGELELLDYVKRRNSG
ncbi:MAG: rhodanese-like domain-containing protein, partial [Chromatiales bacterium]|nr:rhodanese-like domain-containing protein [Chromatiales bacterium]